VAAIAAGTGAVTVTCDIDCTVYARLEKLPRHSTTLVARGKALVGERTAVPFRRTRLARGRYRYTVSLRAPVNPGPPLAVASKTVTVVR
jgi:hypothetical protein